MQPAWRGIVVLLGYFAGLCTLLAGFGTAFDAWREHVHAGWPATEARIDLCEIREYWSSSKNYSIQCHLDYTVAGQAIEAQIGSRMVPDPARVIWQSPGSAELGDLQEWVDAHPVGTAIEVHYDPTTPRNAALVVTDMPLAGPRAPGDLRLMYAFAVLSIVLLLMGRVWRRPQ